MSTSKADMLVAAGKIVKQLEPMSQVQKRATLAFVDTIVNSTGDEAPSVESAATLKADEELAQQ